MHLLNATIFIPGVYALYGANARLRRRPRRFIDDTYIFACAPQQNSSRAASNIEAEAGNMQCYIFSLFSSASFSRQCQHH